MKPPAFPILAASAFLLFICCSCNREAAKPSAKPAQTPSTPTPAATTAASPSIALRQPGAHYSIRQSEETSFGPSILMATLNGKSTALIGKDKKKCLQIVEQRDFDGDGLLDALVEDIIACGGNCCPNRFFFVSLMPDGQFAVSDEFADSWQDPVIEKWKGRWSVVVVSNNAGVNLERPVEFTRRFELEAGKAVKVEEHQKQDMKAILEMRSEIFDFDKGPIRCIRCTTIWMAMAGKIPLKAGCGNAGAAFSGPPSSLMAKTFPATPPASVSGCWPPRPTEFHDLVCDQDMVMHWDGTKYQE